MSDTDDIETIREEKRRELLERARRQQDESTDQSDSEDRTADADAILRQILTEDARLRLNTVRMTHPDRVDRIETKLIHAAQQGRIQDQLDDEQIQALLEELNETDSTNYTIHRR